MSGQIKYTQIGVAGTRGNRLDALLPSRTRLYAGPDHLLILEKDLVQERYQRLYYRDIQAVIWAYTKSWILHLVLIWGLTFLFGMFAVLAKETSAFYFLAIVAILTFFLGLAGILRGKTCQVFIKTPAQQIALCSIERTRELNELLRNLGPLVQQFQVTNTSTPIEPPPTPPPQAPSSTP